MRIFNRYRELLTEKLRTGDRNTLENALVISHVCFLFAGVAVYTFGSAVVSFIEKLVENGFDPFYLIIIVAYILGFLGIIGFCRLMLIHVQTFFDEVVAPNCKE